MGGVFADADFPAAFAQGKDFAGIERAIGIEGVVDAAHEVEVGVGEYEWHELGLFHADAVFSGERAADFEAVTDDFGRGLHGAFELGGVPRIVEDDGMQIAVTGVENVANLKTELRADFLDAPKGLRKLRTGDHAIQDVIAGSETAQRAEGILAAFPEKFALGIVASDADFAGLMRATNFIDCGGLRGDGFGEALYFDEQDRRAIDGKSGVDVVFDGAECPAIEHFAGRGSDAAGGDVHDGLRGIVDRIENGKQCFHGFRLARELDGDFRDEGECAFGANEQAGEVITGRVAVFAADADDFAIRKDEFERGDMIGGDAVRKGVRATGIFGDVAADGTGFPTRRIGSEIEPMRFGGAGEFIVDDAGLHDGALIFGVDFQDAVHAREDEHHSAGAGERAAGEAGAGAAADDRNFIFGGEFDALRDVIGGCGKNDDVGEAFFDGAVVFVEKEIFQLVKNGVFAKKLGQLVNEAWVHGTGNCWRTWHYSERRGAGATPR